MLISKCDGLSLICAHPERQQQLALDSISHLLQIANVINSGTSHPFGPSATSTSGAASVTSKMLSLQTKQLPFRPRVQPSVCVCASCTSGTFPQPSVINLRKVLGLDVSEERRDERNRKSQKVNLIC
jgi:hypothetical protein